MPGGSQWILDFWPLGAGGSIGSSLRALFDLSQVLLLLSLAGFALGLLVAAAIALWRRHVKRLASSLVAVAAIAVCMVVVAKVPLFDPWLWYTIANSRRFEARAASAPSPNGAKYAVVELRDVSTGFVGLSPNHFVALIYDESDATGLEPSERPSTWGNRRLGPDLDTPTIPQGRRLYGHFFRVDVFE